MLCTTSEVWLFKPCCRPDQSLGSSCCVLSSSVKSNSRSTWSMSFSALSHSVLLARDETDWILGFLYMLHVSCQAYEGCSLDVLFEISNGPFCFKQWKLHKSFLLFFHVAVLSCCWGTSNVPSKQHTQNPVHHHYIFFPCMITRESSSLVQMDLNSAFWFSGKDDRKGLWWIKWINRRSRNSID